MRWIIYTIKFVVAAALVYWLIRTDKLDISPLLDRPVGVGHLLGFATILANFLLASFRWHLLLRTQNPEHRFRHTLIWNWIGEFFTLVTPGGSGGEAARAYYAFRSFTDARTMAVSTVLIDRLTGLLAMTLLGNISFVILYLDGRFESDAFLLVGITTILVFFGILIFLTMVFSDTVGSLAIRFIPKRFSQGAESTLTLYARNKKVIFQCLGVSLLTQLFLLWSFMIAGDILGMNLDWKIVILVVPFIFVATVLPITPAGIGVGEAAAAYLFQIVGVSGGATLMIVVRVWLIVLQLSGASLYLLKGPDKLR